MCMCGDTYCPSCGPAQGNNRCPGCGAWDEEGGCQTPEKCQAQEDGPKPKKVRKASKTPHLGLPLFNQKHLRTVYLLWKSALHSPDFWAFEVDLFATCTPIFDEYKTNIEIAAELKKARVLRTDAKVTEEHTATKFIVSFHKHKEGVVFIQRLNQYLLNKEVEFPQGYQSPRAQDWETYQRLKKQYGWN
jgi:hypothetical protein